MMKLEDKIDPKHTALIVIDIQKDFAAPDGIRGKKGGDLSLVEPMIEKLKVTIDAAKNAGIPVLYTQQIYDRSKLNNLQKEQYDLDSKVVMCDINSDGYEYYKIVPDRGMLFTKYNYNVFSNADFKKCLEDRGIKTLIITGMDTIFCVETAVRNGFDLGYKIVVADDLVAGNAKYIEMHNHTLKLVDKYFGVVVRSEEINSIWQSALTSPHKP